MSDRRRQRRGSPPDRTDHRLARDLRQWCLTMANIDRLNPILHLLNSHDRELIPFYCSILLLIQIVIDYD